MQPTPSTLPYRIRYRAPLVFFLGGAIGSGLNIAVSCILYYGSRRLSVPVGPFLAFFFGALANQLFHHFYYHVVYVNQEIRMRTALATQFALYACVAGLALIPLWGLMRIADLAFLPAVVVTIAVLSAANIVLNRLSTFSSAQLAEVEYREMDESFYDTLTDPSKVSRFRAWYHRSRYERMTHFVAQYYKPAMKMADLGCGNCWWNADAIPVTGIDINQRMLEWAKRNRRIADYRVTANLADTGLETGRQDIVLASEVLEHMLNLREVLAEVKRILAPGGVFLLTVPYDFFFGPFFVLFNINCLYMGYLRGSNYHKYRCGHVNHFTKARLRKTLAESGFRLQRVFVVNGLLLYAEARVG
ncbi:MAG TPA: methyltransferase domain-containing protein [Tepidisphaeraceae bacterium]|jgi:SAM-dependent methyltransferase|nr:methyltransferase domain-containing protein [Tepidisphaeraceae bacterium]